MERQIESAFPIFISYKLTDKKKRYPPLGERSNEMYWEVLDDVRKQKASSS